MIGGSLTFDSFPERLLGVLQARHDVLVDLRTETRVTSCSTVSRGNESSANSIMTPTDKEATLSHLEGDLYSVLDSLLHHKRVLL